MITRTFGNKMKAVTVGQSTTIPSDSSSVLPIVLAALGFALILDAARNKI